MVIVTVSKLIILPRGVIIIVRILFDESWWPVIIIVEDFVGTAAGSGP